MWNILYFIPKREDYVVIAAFLAVHGTFADSPKADRRIVGSFNVETFEPVVNKEVGVLYGFEKPEDGIAAVRKIFLGGE